MSLAQYLDQIRTHSVLLLFKKHQLVEDERYDRYPSLGGVLGSILLPADEVRLAALLDEIARTQNSLYAGRNGNKDIYAERFSDLAHCLLLDGYTIEKGRFQEIDPSTQDDAQAVEDELTTLLRASGLPRSDEILRMLDSSTDGFRRPEPDLNGVLNSARIALQTLATDIATQRVAKHPGKFDPEKWGPLIEYLRVSGFIDEREEKGLAGVFTFVSPGSHKPLDLSRTDMARLGRVLVFGMCWFLVKRCTVAIAPAARGTEAFGPIRDAGF